MLYLGFTTLLTSQVINVAFYSEREKYDKFCSEVLISAWGSFTCRKSTTRDQWLYFPSEEALKNPSTPAGFEAANLGYSGEYDNHWTTSVDSNVIQYRTSIDIKVILKYNTYTVLINYIQYVFYVRGNEYR